MRVIATPLAGACVVETDRVSDARGSFERIFCDQDWSAVRPGLRFVQANLSISSHRGTLRGLHYQVPPAAEAKMIRCLRGRVFDVAVDVRAESPTFLQWHAVELDAAIPRQIFLPEGFAHGFQALTDDAQLLYFHTAAWAAAAERGLRWNDPRLAIKWPLPPALLSDRDRSHPLVAGEFQGVQL